MENPTAVVADLKKVRCEAQVYVILSRAQRLTQIFLIGKLWEEKWKTSESALRELRSSEATALNRPQIEVNTLKIISLNILSLQKHFCEVQKILEFLDPDVMCLQETWLQPSAESSQYLHPGYRVHLNSVGRGKGVAVFQKEEFIFQEDVSQNDCQITKVSSPSLDVINVYRSDGCKDLESLLPTSMSERPSLICGDFNIDLKKSGPKQKKLDLKMKENSMIQLVTGSTHAKGGLLDHVYATEDLEKRITIQKRSVRFSDHDMIIIEIEK